MAWAFFSDVHGNREALEAVAADFVDHGVTRSFFLGDAVGYGASPNECVAMISGLTDVRLMGNHDEAALDSTTPEDFNEFARAGVLWTRDALAPKTREEVRSFTMTYSGDGFILAHASPDAPGQWDYILDSSRAERAFAAHDKPMCFIGHTHQPLIVRQHGEAPPAAFHADEVRVRPGERYLVNVGSVGQPRDGDPRACYLLYDAEQRRMWYRRVPYDVRAAQQRIRQANLPMFLAARLEIGR